jgi:four helix bundle protein
MMNDECGMMNEGRLGWELRQRLVQFGVRTIKLAAALPRTTEGRLVRNQVARSGTSPGAQYSEAIRARSAAEFVSKLESGLQELEETIYWLDLMVAAALMPSMKVADLRAEAEELISIHVASIRTVKKRKA